MVNTMIKPVDSKLNPIGCSYRICWSKLIPLKVKCFIWRVRLERIPVSETLLHMCIMVRSTTCLRCGNHNELANDFSVERDY